MESVDHGGQQEVERSKSEHGEDVRREHDERICRDAEDRRNRIDREDEIRQLDEDQDEKQGRRQLAPVLHDKKMLAVKILGERKQATCRADDAILLAVELLVALYSHPDASHDEHGAE